jgi:hypothetical protein
MVAISVSATGPDPNKFAHLRIACSTRATIAALKEYAGAFAANAVVAMRCDSDEFDSVRFIGRDDACGHVSAKPGRRLRGHTPLCPPGLDFL